MSVSRIDDGARDFRSGLRALAGHRPDLALRHIRSAVDSCPATRPAQLSQRLYWLGVALLRLDRPELAMKSLASAQKLRPRGFARKSYERRINDYGMPRRSSVELDDFYAFYSIQTCGFLNRKPERRFSSDQEKDAVTRLVAAAWKGIKASGRLAGLGVADKLELFRRYEGVFPDFMVGGKATVAAKTVNCACEPIKVDFRRGRAIKPDDKCSCGSGLAFRLCCGRTDLSSCSY
jgi:hypothetical protein